LFPGLPSFPSFNTYHSMLYHFLMPITCPSHLIILYWTTCKIMGIIFL
jgi:hypothetical protein